MVQTVKSLPAAQETQARAPGGEDVRKGERLPTAVFLPGEPRGQGAWWTYSTERRSQT